VSELQFRTLYFTLALTSAGGNSIYNITSVRAGCRDQGISGVDAAILEIDTDEHLKTGHRLSV
jgi:hypothetical protein